MVLAEAAEIDILHDHHFVVVLDEHGAVQDLLGVLSVAGGEIAQRLLDTLGRPVQPLALDILTELFQDLRD